MNLNEYILLRGNKLIATGTYEEMSRSLLEKIQGEYPGKFDKIHVEEIDNDWIKQFCLIHYSDEKKFQIIQTK